MFILIMNIKMNKLVVHGWKAIIFLMKNSHTSTHVSSYFYEACNSLNLKTNYVKKRYNLFLIN
jgi:hypothetical protein